MVNSIIVTFQTLYLEEYILISYMTTTTWFKLSDLSVLSLNISMQEISKQFIVQLKYKHSLWNHLSAFFLLCLPGPL